MTQMLNNTKQVIQDLKDNVDDISTVEALQITERILEFVDENFTDGEKFKKVNIWLLMGLAKPAKQLLEDIKDISS